MLSQRLIHEETSGSRASDGHVRSLRRAARCEAHPFGKDLGGVMHARRRYGGDHPYIRAVFHCGQYAAVILQTDEQAALAGTQPVVMADTTFDVVAPGSAKDGASAEAIAAASKHGLDWHHFSIGYVGSFCGGGREC